MSVSAESLSNDYLKTIDFKLIFESKRAVEVKYIA